VTGITPVSVGALHENGTPAFGQPTTAGNLLLAWVATNSSSATFDTSVTGAGWVQAGHGGTASGWASIWYKPNCGNGESPPTFSSGGSSIWSQLGEFSGAAAASPLDQTATGADAQYWGATFPAYDTTGGELATAISYWNGSNTGGTVTVAQAGNRQYQFIDNNGGTITGTLTSAANTFGQYAATLFGVAGNPGSVPHTIRFALTVQAAGRGVAATFKPASPPSAPLAVTTTSLPGRYTTIPYQGSSPVGVNVTGGTPPYTWTVTAGALPAGLSLGSGTGYITGTPTVAGTYNFTVQVTDSAAGSVSAPLTIVITAIPANIYTSTYLPTQSDHFTTPAADPEFTGIGPSDQTWYNPNVWGPVTSPQSTQDSFLQSVHQWYITANFTDPSGAVHTFPNTGAQFPLSPPIAWWKLNYLAAGWDVYMDSDTDIVASACYDLFFDQPLTGQTSGIPGSAEIMAHFDLRNRGDATYASGVQFGGYNAGGYAIPATVWSLSWTPGGGAAFWNLGNPPGTYSGLDVGALDWKPMLQYLVDHGILPYGANLVAFSVGFEVCNTSGNTNTFVYNDTWWHGITLTPGPTWSPSLVNRTVTIGKRIG
jgi:hypothetical protein